MYNSIYEHELSKLKLQAIMFYGADPEKLKDLSLFVKKKKIDDDEVKNKLQNLGLWNDGRRRRKKERAVENLKRRLLGKNG